MAVKIVTLVFVNLAIIRAINCSVENEDTLKNNAELSIQGKIVVNASPRSNQFWTSETRILVDNGEIVSFPNASGHFVVNGLVPGIYDVRVYNIWHQFESLKVRVKDDGNHEVIPLDDLNRKRKRRSYRPYPLVVREQEKVDYFQKRSNEWTMADVMPFVQVGSMVMLFGVTYLMPKFMGSMDQGAQREMQEQMDDLGRRAMQMPDLSEWLTNFFRPCFGPEPSKKPKPKQKAERQKNSKKANDMHLTGEPRKTDVNSKEVENGFELVDIGPVDECEEPDVIKPTKPLTQKLKKGSKRKKPNKNATW